MASGLWSDARWVREVEETLGEWFAEVSWEVPPEQWLDELSELLWEWHREGLTLPEGQVNALERWIADEQAAARGAINSDAVREKPVEAERAGSAVELASVTQSKSPSTSVAGDTNDSAKVEETEPEQPPTNDRSVLGGAPGAFGLYFHFLVDPLTKGVEAIGDQFQTVRNQLQDGKTGEAVKDSLAFGLGIAAENVPEAALSRPVSALLGLAKDEAQSRRPLAYERGEAAAPVVEAAGALAGGAAGGAGKAAGAIGKVRKGAKALQGKAARDALYQVGLAKDLRKIKIADTSTHHVSQSRQAESLLGRFLARNKVGNEPAIRLPDSEHAAVSAAQRQRTAPASARDLLADDIRLLRKHTGAPRTALKKLIEINKDLHKIDYTKLFPE